MKHASFVLAVVLCCSPLVASAEESARALYDRGIAHYKIGEFEAAISDFKAAYGLEPSATLLFNLAQAHRQLGDDKRALFFYRAFVREAPPSQTRTDAEQMVSELETREALRAPIAERVVAQPPPSGTLRPDRRASIALVAATAGLGVVLIATAAGLSAHAAQSSDSLEHVMQGTPWSSTYSSRYDNGHASANAAAALYVVGGSALLASAISAVLCRHALVRDKTVTAPGLSWRF